VRVSSIREIFGELERGVGSRPQCQGFVSVTPPRDYVYVIPVWEESRQTKGLRIFLVHLMFSIKSIRPTFLRRHLNQNSTHTLQINTFSTKQNLKMPLVVPGINSTGEGSKTDEWMNKLVGKKIGETSDATVCHIIERFLFQTLRYTRLSPGLSSPRRLVLSSQDPWSPRTSNPTGKQT